MHLIEVKLADNAQIYILMFFCLLVLPITEG